MSWITAELILDSDTVALFGDALIELGAVSVDIADAQSGTIHEQAIFREPDEDVANVWTSNRLNALFVEGTDVASALTAAAGAAGLASPPPYQTRRVEDQDWVRLTREQFEPILISDRLWVVPSWHTTPDPDAINLVLDPGLAFGTGSHPTTHLCLDWLVHSLRPEQTVIDYGCGSGILAIAAEKLGAVRVVGVDIDKQALEASRYNALCNDVQVQFVDANTSGIGPADVVIANILSGPLRVLAPLLAGLTVPQGRLVLSGILEPQASEIAALYEDWFEMKAPVAREGWVRLEGIRRHR